MRLLLLSLCLFIGMTSYAQESSEISTEYRGEREKLNDLVHTKLDVRFDFAKQHLLGEAWITLEPHFYPVNQLELDAKAMLIHEVKKEGKPLKFEYDGMKLRIDLANTYFKGDQYTIHISYTARPEEVAQEGSSAITSAKGLYFVDPEEKDPNKPTQIWTQGETEASSCWFPTIDAPNQKTSQEIYMTVPDKYVTLSNGLLKSQKDNGDGSRTDYWSFEKKHAPYLFFMGVGEFSIVKDQWKDIAVDYYVEEEYEPYAKGIFGMTPEMLDFFSEYTGIEYPWSKYAQLIARDYVSGAMENTTAVIHMDMAYQTDADLVDENTWESVIAHELFHHWFGDLVTTESWSNLTVNESFANYSEYLWFEHKYGRDYADAHRHKEIEGYISPDNELKDLVRFHYNSREDMFDAVSYNKGGTILHMLRIYLGDEAFKAGLKHYLEQNMYGTAEAHQLRIALEQVSGRDLNWFFNQWYFNNGHPKIDVKYTYSEAAKIVTVDLVQTQAEAFEFPLTIEVYKGDKSKSYNVWVKNKEESFSFQYENLPDLVNVDAQRVLLAEWTDNKTMDNLVHLYQHGPKYEDRREAIEKLSHMQAESSAFETLVSALEDDFYGLRILALDKIDLSQPDAKKAIKLIEKMASNDPKTLVRAKAIEILSKQAAGDYISLYTQAMSEKSSAIRINALDALYRADQELAMEYAGKIESEMEKESLKQALIPIYIISKTDEELPFVAQNLIEGIYIEEDRQKRDVYKEGFQWVALSDNVEGTQNLVNAFVQLGIQYKAYGWDQAMRQALQQVLEAKQQSDFENKEELVKIVEDGLVRLQ